MQKPRISVLDSFRALAILSVLLFHYFTRWTQPHNTVSLYPYNDEYSYFEYGHLGVAFFFIISGFVIFFTLENTPHFKVFWEKRLIRLVPPIAIASLLTFTVVSLLDWANVFPSSHLVKNFIPSISFISPQLLNTITGHDNFGYIDGSYWSLWPEVQFYLLSSIVFFINKEKFVRNFVCVSLLLIVANAGEKFLKGKNGLGIIPESFFDSYQTWIDKGFDLLNYLPFFTIGVLFYILYKNYHMLQAKTNIYIKLAMAFLILFILVAHGGLDVPIIIRVIYAMMLCIFFLFVYKPQMLSIFENKLLIRIGVSSYFLYLIHQNIGVLIIYYFGKYFLPVGFVLPLMLMVFMTIISILYSENIDKKINKWLRDRLIKKTGV